MAEPFATRFEEVEHWLLNYARNASNSTPAVFAIYDEKAECAEMIGINEVAHTYT